MQLYGLILVNSNTVYVTSIMAVHTQKRHASQCVHVQYLCESG